jgi:hypothetical protein
VSGEDRASQQGSRVQDRLSTLWLAADLCCLQVEEFRGRISIPADAVIAAGGQSTFCTGLWRHVNRSTQQCSVGGEHPVHAWLCVLCSKPWRADAAAVQLGQAEDQR